MAREVLLLVKRGIGMVFCLALVACNMPALQKTLGTPSNSLPSETAPAQPALLPSVTAAFTPTLPPTATPTATPPPPTATAIPSFTPTPVPCTDRATFVKDLTIPEGSALSPDASFTKTWRVKNTGTCSWTTGYQMVFLDGERMDGPDPVNLPDVVPPGKTVDLSIAMTAPSSVGLYEGHWQLRTPTGKGFDINQAPDNALSVNINVIQSASGMKLNTPLWRDTFKNDANWYLVDTANTYFFVKNKRMWMNVVNPARKEEWGLATHAPVADFYIDATFTMGDECEGLDRYGLFLRTPKPNNGYVFDFSCDGHYRFYKWNGSDYKPLDNWTSSASIKTGPGQTNRMGFWAKGENIKLYANGALLDELSDNTYHRGRFGLVVGSAETEDLVVYVNEVSLWSVGK